MAEEETVAEETAPEAGRGEEGEAEEPVEDPDADVPDADVPDADVPDRPEERDSAEAAAPVEEGEVPAADGAQERVEDGTSADESAPAEAEVEEDEQRAIERELEEAQAVREEAARADEAAADEGLSPEEMVDRLIVRDAVEDLPDPGVHSIARSAAAFDAESWANVFSLDDDGLRDRVAARERARGFLGDHQAEWEQLRRALENHDVRARAGRETSLNTRADAFAGYIHYLHDKIHARWPAYLRSLDFGVPADHPLSDRRLWVHLEMGISQHGEVVEVNVIRTSGQLTFDAQAIRIVQTIGPHRSPPQAMVSPDGNAWIHWRFHRDQRQCGTFGVDVRLLAADGGDESSERQDRASRER
ncbi:MAG: hypothetical protein EA398_12445 [Deltaproteobacteria bacterium]|nr:MAG: hypothetical protein EA398_12445 [Deltaproteobacteria bacterium]